MSGLTLRSFGILLLMGSLVAVVPGGAAEGGIANVRFEAQVPAPTLALAASADGEDVLVVDEESRFTFIPGIGEDEMVWRAPKTGALAALGPTMGEVDPVPLGVAVTPDGEHWAGTVRYDGEFGGRLWTFARWSDEPIWSYDLSDGSREADQPNTVAAGGPYIVLGTEKGYVYVFRAADGDDGEVAPYRTYRQDNVGNAFMAIQDVAVSRDGKRFLIGTAQNEKGSVHLYSDTFFMSSFKRITDTVAETAISADGTRGAVVAGQGAAARLHLLDLTRGRTIWETTLGTDAPALAFSADGKTLVAGTDDGDLLVFYESGHPTDRDPIREHRFADAVTSATIADDGRAIAAGTASGRLHFLDRARPAPLWTYDAGSPIIGTRLSADAEGLVLSARTDSDARVIYTAADHDLEQMAPPQPRLAPGVVNTVPVEVQNNGNRMETVTVTWGSLPKGWEGLATNVTVAPGEAASLSAKVSVAKGQAAGTHPLPITLVAGQVTIPLALTAVVPEMTSGQTAPSWSLPAAVPGGAPAAFVFTLENTGNTLNEATLGYAKLPAGWRAEFVGPTEFRLKPGEDRQVAMKVWAPAGETIGREGWFDVVVAWTHGEERVPLAVRLVDAPAYRELLSLDKDDPSIGALPGELEAESLKAPKKVSESKDSPAAGPLLLVVALVGVVFYGRRWGA